MGGATYGTDLVNTFLFFFCFSLSLGGKTPDANARLYADVMKEDMLKKQEVCLFVCLLVSAE